MRTFAALFVGFDWSLQAQSLRVTGHALDPQGKPMDGPTVRLMLNGFSIARLSSGSYTLRAEWPDFVAVSRKFAGAEGQSADVDLQFLQVSEQHQRIVITAKTLEPGIDLRNSEVFNRTLFTRDDQVLQQLNAGINAGQPEGGGTAHQIPRFRFNLHPGRVHCV